MFNSNLFDHSVYDRSVASEGMRGILLSISHMNLQITIMQPLSLTSLSSQGILDTGLQLQIPAGSAMEASGNLNNSEVILRHPLTIGLSGRGDPVINATIKTPISAAVGGGGTLDPVNAFVYQHMVARLLNSSDISIDLVLKQELNVAMPGSNTFIIEPIIMTTTLSFDLSGNGTLGLRRLGTLNEDLFQLININLQPGEEITIDTDLLDVAFGHISDVSSVTTDSVFFDLNPGENEITVFTDTQEPMQITAIWQNRWL